MCEDFQEIKFCGYFEDIDLVVAYRNKVFSHVDLKMYKNVCEDFKIRGSGTTTLLES